MEAKGRDACCITVPLLVDKEGHKLNDSKCPDQLNTGTTSFFKTCFHTINYLSGIGMLSIPYALSSGGWFSLIFLFSIALATSYTGLLTKRCMDLHPNTKTYPDIGQVAFGKKGRFLLSVFVHLELYLAATSFLIMEGDNLHKLFPVAGLEIAGLSIDGKQMFIVIVAIVILPTVLLKDMSILSYISASGVLASVIVVASVFWVGAFDGVEFHGKVEPVRWSGLPKAISIYAICYSAHPLFPTIYTSMRNQTQFPKVLRLSFLFSTVLCALMGVLGCPMFGSEVQSQITLNLPTEKISSKVAIYTTLAIPIVKYALSVTPIVHGIENRFPASYNKTRVSLLVRITMVISTVLVALLFPSFIDLMSLVGAFLIITACIILPCSICYLKISGIYKRRGFEIVTIGGILAISVFISIIGTCDSVVEIIRKL